MAGCATCPDAVRAVLRRRVRTDLSRVRAIKYFTTALNRLLTELADKVAADLVALIKLVENIPAPILDISELVNWLTCPLVPVALAEEELAREGNTVAPLLLSQLDPETQVRKLTAMMGAYVEYLETTYQEGLERLQSYDIIKMAKRYLEELRRLDFDSYSFARSVSINAVVWSLGEMDSGCRDEYYNGPYNEFEEEISTFAFTGLYPDGFSPQVKQVMDELAKAEAKLSGWRLVIVTGL